MSNNKKMREEIRKNQQKLDSLNFQNQCKCPHKRRDGNSSSEIITLTKNKHRKEGQPDLICEMCGKPVSIRKISRQEVEDAVRTIDSVCDTIKIITYVKGEKEAKIIEEIEKLQYKINKSLIPAYLASLDSEAAYANARSSNKSRSRNVHFNDPKSY